MAGGALSGSMFGRYELRRLLGVGGMGEVYEAFDTSKNRTVALKVLNREFAVDPTYVERFRRESYAMASVSEPHVIPVHDWGEVDGILYIDMRLVDGGDLKERIGHHGKLTPTESVQVIEQIASALDAAHRQGLVHRDVKPGNILLTGDLFAYLVDFGIAHAVADPQLTSTGSAVGSMAYMAPERFDDVPMSGTVDTYSLACVLYECLVGRVPFPVNSLAAAIGSHQMAPPPRPSAVDEALWPFDAVIERGMAKRPEARYATSGDLARAARAALVQIDRASPSTVASPAIASLEQRPHIEAPAVHPASPLPTAPSPAVDASDARLDLTKQSGPHATSRPSDVRGSGPIPVSAFSPVANLGVHQQDSRAAATNRWTGSGPVPGTRAYSGDHPYGSNSGGFPTHPSAPFPVRQQRGSATPILAGALGALIVIAVVGLVVWVMMLNSQDKKAQVTPTIAGPGPTIVTASQETPGTYPQAPPAQQPPKATQPAKTTVPAMQGAVSGADGQGFTAGPRCNDDDAAFTVARTSSSRIVICHTGVGRYYYKGLRTSDSAGIELDDPVPTGGGGFTATNTTDNTQYQVTASGLTIMRGSSVLASEPMVEFAHR
ncbi:serine/threonine-protein kinase [Nocardia camponoti]|uniref:non-specific serine/threonine protein kinase n=1 Tax=Nocardia camponoti TaxID=1616106 RepID=A0A917QH32_9NOCA|nr:serine/threonine-protein kinase [Nocardia camponoti]GGK50099.1 serine/threonine-protein kinase PknH [Nocardia camponoti]